MNKKLFFSISLLTASFACAENSFTNVYDYLNQEDQVLAITKNPADVKNAAEKAMNKVSAGSKSAYAWLNQVPTYVKDAYAKAAQNAIYGAHAVKANTWDRSITFRGTEYKDAGKYMTSGAGVIVAATLAYKYGVFGKIRSAVSTAYTAVKGFRPFAKKAQSVAKSVAPVAKSVEPVVAPVAKSVEPVVAPVAKSVAPVAKSVEPVVAPVAKSVAPVVKSKRSASALKGAARYVRYVKNR